MHGGIIEVRNALPWRSGRFHFKVLQGSSDPDEGNHFIRSVAGLLEDWDDSLTRQVTEETERDLEELGRRYMATQDKLGASLILLVKINARWYLLIGNNDDDEFRRMLDELDDLIDNTQLLLDDTRQELDDASQLEGNTQRTQDAQEIVQEAAP